MWTTPEYTADFCKRWLCKAHRCDLSDLGGAFDRFVSLFIAFNGLFSHFGLRSRCRGDRRQATSCFRTAVGEAALLAALREDGGKDMQALAALIGVGGDFFVCTDGHHQPDDEADERLKAHLTEGSPTQQVDAMLNYIYSVRCNMFHGHKAFVDSQLRMLRPLCRCLERVVLVGLQRFESVFGVAG